MSGNYKVKRCLFMTVDPIHIGTGGYRLGRVDASIAREPGTNLPKIPGTSLHGAARHYAAYRYNKPQCAGQNDHCGNKTCPICYTFGHSKDSSGEGYAGVVSISDAQLLMFPVNSMRGPLWVTTRQILSTAGFTYKQPAGDSEALTSFKTKGHINLGWLVLKTTGEQKISDLSWEYQPTQSSPEWDAIQDKIVIVDENYFSRIVNSNLEVRTSVSIDPSTGAAKDGALFTYEAIPRATFLWMDIIIDDYRDGDLWKDGGVRYKCFYDEPSGKLIDNDTRGGAIYPAADNGNNLQSNGLPKGWTESWSVIEAGLEWVEYLGVGGMGTRGFGRLRKLGMMGEVV